MAIWKVMMVDQERCLLPPIEVDEDYEFTLKDGTKIKIKDTPEGEELELEDGRCILASCNAEDLKKVVLYVPDGKGNMIGEDGTIIPDPFRGELPGVDRDMVERSREWFEQNKEKYRQD